MEHPIPATIQKVETLTESIRIQIDSQELITPDALAEVFSLKGKVGYFFFFEDEKNMLVDKSKLPPIVLEEGEKSPSQRLRNTLYVFWEQNKKGELDFELYYRQQMGRIIDQIKERLT